MASAPRTPIRPQSLSELARDAIRAAISAGEFQPGDRLTERSLAERLGMSAMPIRTALAALCEQGIAVREAQRGVRVAGVRPASTRARSPIAGLRPLPFEGIVDATTDRLRSDIVSGELRAGVRLVERDIARELGISPSSVREALRRLGDQGLVTSSQRRGVRVASLSAADYTDNASVLGALGRQALAAIPRHQRADVAREACELAAGAVPNAVHRDRKLLHDLDVALFGLLGRRSGNELLARLLPDLRVRATATVPVGVSLVDGDLRRAWSDAVVVLAGELGRGDGAAAGVALDRVIALLVPASAEISATPDEAAAAPAERVRRSVERATLRLHWWGEQEAPGLHAWLDAASRAFEAEHECTVQSRLLDTGELAGYRTPRIPSSADVTFTWNGLFHVEAAWAGDLLALGGGVLDDATLRASGATSMSRVGDAQYRVGFFGLAIGLALNRELLADAGCTPLAGPTTYAWLADAAERVAATGVRPIAVGTTDTYAREWIFAAFLVQQIDRLRDVHDLVLGRRAWDETDLPAAWQGLRDLAARGFTTPEAAEATTRDAVQAFYDGRAAFCPLSSTALAEAQSYLGADAVDFIPFPSVDPAASRFAGRPVMDSQGFSIPIHADEPVLAARFLAHIHQRQWAERLWTLGRQLPASRVVEPAAIDDPRQQQLYAAWLAGAYAPFATNLLPRPVRQRLIPATLRGVLTGELAPGEIPELARRACERWRRESPAEAAAYADWADDFRDPSEPLNAF